MNRLEETSITIGPRYNKDDDDDFDWGTRTYKEFGLTRELQFSDVAAN